MSSGVRRNSQCSKIVSKLVKQNPPIHFNKKEDLIAMLWEKGIKKSDVREIEYLGDRVAGFTKTGKHFVICPS